MATKILAAKIAVAAGCHMCIAAGHHRHPVRRHRRGRALHLVRAARDPGGGAQAMDRRDLCDPRGAMTIDAGALRRCSLARVCCPLA